MGEGPLRCRQIQEGAEGVPALVDAIDQQALGRHGGLHLFNVLVIVGDGGLAIGHGAAVGPLPNQVVGHVAQGPGEGADGGEQLELPHPFAEIDRFQGALVPGVGAAGMEREDHLGVGIGFKQLPPDAAGRVIHGSPVAGEHLIPGVGLAGLAMGHPAPKGQMVAIGPVLQHLHHVVAGQAEAVEGRVQGQGARAAEASTDQLQRHGSLPPRGAWPQLQRCCRSHQGACGSMGSPGPIGQTGIRRFEVARDEPGAGRPWGPGWGQ